MAVGMAFLESSLPLPSASQHEHPNAVQHSLLRLAKADRPRGRFEGFLSRWTDLEGKNRLSEDPNPGALVKPCVCESTRKRPHLNLLRRFESPHSVSIGRVVSEICRHRQRKGR